jgi:hypothetical protein
MKELPIGTYSFRDIITKNKIYADKTEYIYKILKKDLNYCFLSRPRRFGKTLLLNTIQELFLGDRELFKNLWIYSSDYNFESHPVIKFDMSFSGESNNNILYEKIIAKILEIGNDNNIIIRTNELYGALSNLLVGLKNKYNAKVVILIDEYDYPISQYVSGDTKNNVEILNNNTKLLHDFYTYLKSLYESIHLVFVTGVTKFAMTALASGANNYIDISLNREFSGICGFTIEEFNLLFSDYLVKSIEYFPKFKDLPLDKAINKLRDKIFNYYDGYNWRGNSNILNPFSILNFFMNNEFATYWYSTGQLKQLKNIMQKQLWNTIHPELTDYLQSQIQITEFGSLNIVPLLFHYGYLTINSIITKEIKDNNGNTSEADFYSFKIPNNEVNFSFKNDILTIISDMNKFIINNDTKDKLSKILLNKDNKSLENLMESIYSSAIYYNQRLNEQFFQALFHIYLIGAKFEVLSEQPSAKGRLDLLIMLDSSIYIIFEFKYISYDEKYDEEKINFLMNEKCNEALEQIENNGYEKPYLIKAKKIIKLGLTIYGKDKVMVKFA